MKNLALLVVGFTAGQEVPESTVTANCEGTNFPCVISYSEPLQQNQLTNDGSSKSTKAVLINTGDIQEIQMRTFTDTEAAEDIADTAIIG